MTRIADKAEELKSEPFYIRQVTIEDAPNLVKYLRDILSDPMASVADLDEMVLDPFREREHIRKISISDTGLGIIAAVRANSSRLLNAADHYDEIIGFLTLEPTRRRKIKHVVELGMSVRDDWRGKGVGRKLVDYAVNWAKHNSRIEKIVLNVFSGNQTALSLYDSAGFKVEGTLKRQIKIEGEYQDLVLMALII
jgi:RimJ/RimL family protein N-acetyltransferase